MVSKLRLYTLQLIGTISYPGEYDLMVTRESMASFSHECILLPLYVYNNSYSYNMHQDRKSARLIAVCKRTLKLE